MFYLSQTLWPFFEPSRILLLAALATCALAVTGGWRVRILAATLVVFIVFVGLVPAGGWLLIPLEARFPLWYAPSSPPLDGIIALGGDSGHRVEELARVSRLFPDAKLVYSGRGDRRAAEYELRHAGLDPAHVVIESTSRTTSENAADSAQLVRPSSTEHWLLITSAAHMPRAIGCFRRAGFDVVADPVDFHTDPTSYEYADTAPQHVDQLDDAVKEWLGLVAYRMTDNTNALFPRP